MGTPTTAVQKAASPGSSSCHCPVKSAILLKAIMAITGLILFGFTIVHALGNLLVFLPAEAINSYGYLLHHSGLHGFTLIWPFRLFLLAAAVAHIVAAIILTKRNRAARPVPYAVIKANKATFASRTMFVGGLVLAVFIVFHILQFTVEAGPFATSRGYEAPVSAADVATLNLLTVPDVHNGSTEITAIHDIHRMVVEGFSNVWISAFYLISVAILGLHLNHGAAALFRSLGIGNRATFPWQNFIARAFGLFVFLAMAAVPLGVLTGIVK
ncbi:succinate dehydrogenase / fumarate reductase cytochrome b subunit [Verrucomicrobium sp. GAS474]|uniref:succinate dehydrogenase cytochrome b subunit n=1 Tax=Verrucomicrobium sp. GAS474 TaxID=1882831 RepID=UPI000879E4FF|nr:succinate dehydrogenase cytochrome b subunit [Verrucomicrobium sp. GAS474]SDU30236.1 succinate dehydrogenase / fumarate reductase cytochrome b subunit [Verrucomicrobium sp. GAS474]